MNLGAAKARHSGIWGEAQKEIFFSRWMEHPCSSIVHHEKKCCEEARLWFLAYARSMEGTTATQNKLRPPVWLGQLYTWGPSHWPIAWCELIEEKILDCGVFAALAREIFQAQGVSVHPAQALISYNEGCTGHWKDLWREAEKKEKGGNLFPWVGEKIVYHEVCILEMPAGAGKLYDSTFSHWMEPENRAGFGAMLAVRTECPRLLSWGGKTLSHGEWVEL